MTEGMTMTRRFVFGIVLLGLILVSVVKVSSVVSQPSPPQSRFEYRVIEVPPDTRSIQAALDEYGHGGWELVAFEMGELQAPRMIFKKGNVPVS